MKMKWFRANEKWFGWAVVALVTVQVLSPSARAQSAGRVGVPVNRLMVPTSALLKYLDPEIGTTADEAVAYALAHNGELLAARTEIEAGRALVRQAGLRANPSLDINGAKQANGPDYDKH